MSVSVSARIPGTAPPSNPVLSVDTETTELRHDAGPGGGRAEGDGREAGHEQRGDGDD